MLKIEIKDNEELKTHNPALNSDAKGFRILSVAPTFCAGWLSVMPLESNNLLSYSWWYLRFMGSWGHPLDYWFGTYRGRSSLYKLLCEYDV